jgi:hypothetical protein
MSCHLTLQSNTARSAAKPFLQHDFIFSTGSDFLILLFKNYRTKMKEQLLELISASKSNALAFTDVIKFIDTYYQHQPVAFKNGDVDNEATQNQGSAKVFAFGQINGLGATDTLYLFAEHYQAVMADPTGTNHQNIRQFMMHGWPGVVFEGNTLVVKK